MLFFHWSCPKSCPKFQNRPVHEKTEWLHPLDACSVLPLVEIFNALSQNHGPFFHGNSQCIPGTRFSTGQTPSVQQDMQKEAEDLSG